MQRNCPHMDLRVFISHGNKAKLYRYSFSKMNMHFKEEIWGRDWLQPSLLSYEFLKRRKNLESR